MIGYGLGGAMILHILDEELNGLVNSVVLINLPVNNALQADPVEEIPPASEPATNEEETAAAEEPPAEPAPAENAEPAEPLPESENLITLMKKVRIPMIEILAQRDYRRSLDAAALRKKAMQQEREVNYRQIIVKGAGHHFYRYEDALLRKIRGGLKIPK